MMMRRIIPPAAAPMAIRDLLYGFSGFFLAKHYKDRLKNDLSKYFGVKKVYLLSSGKASLAIILRALKEGESRNEVIIPAYTCYSVPSAIVKEGLKVVLCDIVEDTLDYNYEQLEHKINGNTLCVLTGNLFGIPSDTDKLVEMCQKKKTFVVEDAAQAMGVVYKNKYIGITGDVAFFSLGRGKNVTSNNGGIIITSSKELSTRLDRIYKNLSDPTIFNEIKEYILTLAMAIFINPLFYWIPAGIPSLKLGETIFHAHFPIKRLSGVKAALMLNWKNRLSKSNKFRRKNIQLYCPGLNNPVPCIRMPCIVKDENDRNRIYQESQDKGLGISKMYPAPVNEIPEIESQFFGQNYPVSSNISKNLICLPTHQLLAERDLLDIKALLNKYLKSEDMCRLLKNAEICSELK